MGDEFHPETWAGGLRTRDLVALAAGLTEHKSARSGTGRSAVLRDPRNTQVRIALPNTSAEKPLQQ